MSDIIDFSGRKLNEEASKPKPGKWRFYIYPQADGAVDLEVQEAEGFVKFGPMFTAVTETQEDTSTILLAVANPTIKYVRKID